MPDVHQPAGDSSAAFQIKIRRLRVFRTLIAGLLVILGVEAGRIALAPASGVAAAPPARPIVQLPASSGRGQNAGDITHGGRRSGTKGGTAATSPGTKTRVRTARRPSVVPARLASPKPLHFDIAVLRESLGLGAGMPPPGRQSGDGTLATRSSSGPWQDLCAETWQITATTLQRLAKNVKHGISQVALARTQDGNDASPAPMNSADVRSKVPRKSPDGTPGGTKDRTTIAAVPGGAGAIVIVNSASNGGQIHFLLDGAVATLNPGEFRRVEVGQLHKVQFHRGGDFGYVGYSLPGGTYHFAITDRGWELFAVEESDQETDPLPR